MRKKQTAQQSALLSHINIQISAGNIRREREAAEQGEGVGGFVSSWLQQGTSPTRLGVDAARMIQSAQGGRRRR